MIWGEAREAAEFAAAFSLSRETNFGGEVETPQARGLFCVLEGASGSGMGSLLQALADTLREHGHAVVETGIKDGTPLCAEVQARIQSFDAADRDPLLEVMLLTAARRDLLRRVIRPALARGAVVLCEQFVHASLVEQSGLTDLVASEVLELHAAGCDDVWPDLTLLLGPPLRDDAIFASIIEDESLRTAHAYRNAMRYTPRGDYGLIDATAPLPGRLDQALRILRRSALLPELRAVQG